MVYGGQETRMKISWRVWLLIFVLILSLLAISPSFQEGVKVKSVDKNSDYFNSGLRSGEIIKQVNGQKISDISQYSQVIDGLFNGSEEVKIDIKTDKGEYIILTNKSPEFSVDKIPMTRIQMGLDLIGGARALVQPEANVSDSQMNDLVEVARNRFNVYGLSDVNIRIVNDLTGEKFMLVEIAGASPEDLKGLVAQQGKFEGKIANKTVFEGGENDISDVCRNDAQCSGVRSCDVSGDGSYYCQFEFAVYLTQDAAKKHAAATGNLSLYSSGQYLSEKLDLYVDDSLVESLSISVNLRGQETTQISIQGSGTGKTQEEALKVAKEDMKKLQTILITGSMPYKLKIVKLDTISPTLGDEFTRLILLAGIGSILAVGLIVLVRYRKVKASLALLFTSFSEIIIILGIAALVKWNLDLPSIAGILATIGTGVDQQIVILDEARRGVQSSLKDKMKRALFIIVSAYFTALVALLPLFWAGAGLFRGFAFTTLIGITAGVLISRPAFSDMIRAIEEKID
jgi:preprotein translocase subunit SecD